MITLGLFPLGRCVPAVFRVLVEVQKGCKMITLGLFPLGRCVPAVFRVLVEVQKGCKPGRTLPFFVLFLLRF
jgi:hypothetical protein